MSTVNLDVDLAYYATIEAATHRKNGDTEAYARERFADTRKIDEAEVKGWRMVLFERFGRRTVAIRGSASIDNWKDNFFETPQHRSDIIRDMQTQVEKWDRESSIDAITSYSGSTRYGSRLFLDRRDIKHISFNGDDPYLDHGNHLAVATANDVVANLVNCGVPYSVVAPGGHHIAVLAKDLYDNRGDLTVASAARSVSQNRYFELNLSDTAANVLEGALENFLIGGFGGGGDSQERCENIDRMIRETGWVENAEALQGEASELEDGLKKTDWGRVGEAVFEIKRLLALKTGDPALKEMKARSKQHQRAMEHSEREANRAVIPPFKVFSVATRMNDLIEITKELHKGYRELKSELNARKQDLSWVNERLADKKHQSDELVKKYRRLIDKQRKANKKAGFFRKLLGGVSAVVGITNNHFLSTSSINTLSNIFFQSSQGKRMRKLGRMEQKMEGVHRDHCDLASYKQAAEHSSLEVDAQRRAFTDQVVNYADYINPKDADELLRNVQKESQKAIHDLNEKIGRKREEINRAQSAACPSTQSGIDLRQLREELRGYVREKRGEVARREIIKEAIDINNELRGFKSFVWNSVKPSERTPQQAVLEERLEHLSDAQQRFQGPYNQLFGAVHGLGVEVSHWTGSTAPKECAAVLQKCAQLGFVGHALYERTRALSLARHVAGASVATYLCGYIIPGISCLTLASQILSAFTSNAELPSRIENQLAQLLEGYEQLRGDIKKEMDSLSRQVACSQDSVVRVMEKQFNDIKCDTSKIEDVIRKFSYDSHRRAVEKEWRDFELGLAPSMTQLSRDDCSDYHEPVNTWLSKTQKFAEMIARGELNGEDAVLPNVPKGAQVAYITGYVGDHFDVEGVPNLYLLNQLQTHYDAAKAVALKRPELDSTTCANQMRQIDASLKKAHARVSDLKEKLKKRADDVARKQNEEVAKLAQELQEYEEASEKVCQKVVEKKWEETKAETCSNSMRFMGKSKHFISDSFHKSGVGELFPKRMETNAFPRCIKYEAYQFNKEPSIDKLWGMVAAFSRNCFASEFIGVVDCLLSDVYLGDRYRDLQATRTPLNRIDEGLANEMDWSFDVVVDVKNRVLTNGHEHQQLPKLCTLNVNIHTLEIRVTEKPSIPLVEKQVTDEEFGERMKRHIEFIECKIADPAAEDEFYGDCKVVFSRDRGMLPLVFPEKLLSSLKKKIKWQKAQAVLMESVLVPYYSFNTESGELTIDFHLGSVDTTTTHVCSFVLARVDEKKRQFYACKENSANELLFHLLYGPKYLSSDAVVFGSENQFVMGDEEEFDGLYKKWQSRAWSVDEIQSRVHMDENILSSPAPVPEWDYEVGKELVPERDWKKLKDFNLKTAVGSMDCG